MNTHWLAADFTARILGALLINWINSRRERQDRDRGPGRHRERRDRDRGPGRHRQRRPHRVRRRHRHEC